MYFFCTNIIKEDKSIEGKWKVFIWKDFDFIYICGASIEDNIKKIAIPINNIQFYTRKGEIKNISKTEGGDIRIGKAIFGGIVGVVVGWIIGSIMDTYSDISNFRIFTHSSIFTTVLTIIGLLLAGKEKVTTTNNEIDNRKTYLNYLEGDCNKQIIFNSTAYEMLFELIPERDMDYVGSNKIIEFESTQQSINNNESDNIYKDIEKLAELKDKGILTEEEFNQKKQVLLDRI